MTIPLAAIKERIIGRLRELGPKPVSGEQLCDDKDDTRMWFAMGHLVAHGIVEVVGGYRPDISVREQLFRLR